MPGDPLWPKVDPVKEAEELRKKCPTSADFLRHIASLDSWSPVYKERWIEAAGDLDALLKISEATCAIVDKLRKTKDGVSVVPSKTTTVYYIHPLDGKVYARPYEANLDGCRSHRDKNNEVVWIGIEDCYSTRKAAEAVREEAGS